MTMNNTTTKKILNTLVFTQIALLGFVSLTHATPDSHEVPTSSVMAHAHAEENTDSETAEGSHGGRLFSDGKVTVELLLSEDEKARAWIHRKGKPQQDDNTVLTLSLKRLDGKVERINFQPRNDYWLANRTIEEPHSFDVSVQLNNSGEAHAWTFSAYENRVEIKADIAKQSGIKSQIAGAGVIEKTIKVYGKVVEDPSSINHIRARYAGTITRVYKRIGESVSKGERMLTVESRDSLTRYDIQSPVSGIISQQHANPGEIALDQPLFTVVNYDRMWADLQIFPSQSQQVKPTLPVIVSMDNRQTPSTIEFLLPSNTGQPFTVAKVSLDNSEGKWSPGLLVEGTITVERIDVPLAVDNRALQSLSDERVVFIQAGNAYEPRALTLGRTDGKFTEVLAGLNKGDRYVVENSYLIKADIEKSGASHAH